MASAGLGLTGLMMSIGARPARSASTARTPLVWVWQFSLDDKPEVLAQRLAQYGLGILMKTHDGLKWMSTYDPTPEAIDGPHQVAALARYFEGYGVPFHAWCVVTGDDPAREAQMAASVLEAGARSLYLDIEPHAGFWQGSPEDARAYAAELRRLCPRDEIVLSIDPRPWNLRDTPMDEMTPYVDALAPQQYWTMFDSEANRRLFAADGFEVPPGGPSPEFLLDISNRLLGRYSLPVYHIGPGDSQSTGDWRRFISASPAGVSLWRYGITNDAILSTLGSHSPVLTLSHATGGAASYIVRPGDSLSAIAEVNGISTAALKDFNQLEDEDYIYAGQRLELPQTSGSLKPISVTASGHTVQPGDTLYSIAAAYDTTIDDLVGLNGLSDPDVLVPGQNLQVAN